MAVEDGLQGWRQQSNQNRMIELQRTGGADGPVRIAFFGSSAFRITTPSGMTVMLDPWRNHPARKWDWYFHDFPDTSVDIGVSTHAHFDHDALHLLDASVLLDRLIGTYEFADVRIIGIADKHAIDMTYATYDAHRINSYFGGQNLDPPNNARSWDNILMIVETGGLRILHWGDNRHDAPDEIWERIGPVDILLMPVDDSQHVMGNPMVEAVIRRTDPKVVIPHHYYIWNVVQRGSTLLGIDRWLETQENVVRLDGPEAVYDAEKMPRAREVHSFGDHVAFDVDAWHQSNGLKVGG